MLFFIYSLINCLPYLLWLGIKPETSVCALIRNGSCHLLMYGMMRQPIELPVRAVYLFQGQIIFHCTDCTVFSFPLICPWTLSCFHVLAIVNNAAVVRGVQMHLSACFHLFAYIFHLEVSWWIVSNSTFNFQRYCHTFSILAAHFTFPPTVHRSSRFSICLPTLPSSLPHSPSLFCNSHHNGCENAHFDSSNLIALAMPKSSCVRSGVPLIPGQGPSADPRALCLAQGLRVITSCCRAFLSWGGSSVGESAVLLHQGY